MHRPWRPTRWRIGALATALNLALWPPIYFFLWQQELQLGLVWIAVFGVTALCFKWGLNQMMVETDRPTALSSRGRR